VRLRKIIICVKTDEDRMIHTVSSATANLHCRDCSFWQYKVFADSVGLSRKKTLKDGGVVR